MGLPQRLTFLCLEKDRGANKSALLQGFLNYHHPIHYQIETSTMPFIPIRGLPGRLYVPETHPSAPKKHSCPDCFMCQLCSAERCRLCRGSGPSGKNAIRQGADDDRDARRAAKE
jgi:hypothetical protein